MSDRSVQVERLAGENDPEAAPPSGPARGRRLLPAGATDSLGLLAVLALLVAFFGSVTDYFLTPLTFRTLLNQIPALTLVSVGMTYVLIIAGIDLSVGSVLALSGGVLGYLLVQSGAGLGVAGLGALAAGALLGCFNGFVTVRWAIPSFIVTLGMLEIARGGAYLVTGSQTLYVGGAVASIGDPVSGLGLSPAFLLALACVVVGQVVLSRTVFGRYAVAIGTNREAVRLSGIDPRPVEVAVFSLSGLLAALGGVVHVGYLGSADPNAGLGLELSAIAAVVIGGTSLMGGRGSVVNGFLGVLIISVLQVGLAQVGASEPTKRVVTGAVIVVAVIADAYRRRLTVSGGLSRLIARGRAAAQ